MHFDVRPRRLLLAVTLGAACAGALTQASPALASSPAPTVCNGPPPSAFCYYEVGIVPFTLSSHFVHVGHILSGTALKGLALCGRRRADHVAGERVRLRA
jgi:hypothetical protein